MLFRVDFDFQRTCDETGRLPFSATSASRRVHDAHRGTVFENAMCDIGLPIARGQMLWSSLSWKCESLSEAIELELSWRQALSQERAAYSRARPHSRKLSADRDGAGVDNDDDGIPRHLYFRADPVSRDCHDAARAAAVSPLANDLIPLTPSPPPRRQSLFMRPSEVKPRLTNNPPQCPKSPSR